MSTLKTDQKVMELLKVTDISRLIAYTSLGDLKLQLRKDESEYRLVLDAVPLEKELNSELMDLLFSKENIPTVNKEMSNEKLKGIVKRQYGIPDDILVSKKKSDANRKAKKSS